MIIIIMLTFKCTDLKFKMSDNWKNNRDNKSGVLNKNI